MASWLDEREVAAAKADEWLNQAKTKTQAWLTSFTGAASPMPDQQTAVPEPAPAMPQIKLPTAEELRALAPWRDLDPQPAQTPATLVDGRQQPQPRMRPGEQMGSVSITQGTGDLRSYARSEAQRLGIDPDIAERVAMSEGGFDDPVRQSDVVYQGEREQSYGPYQLNVNGGLGNVALQQGIDPRNPAHARAAVTFALEHAARNGWGAFHGAARVGIDERDGIGQAPVQGPRPTTPPQAEQTPAAMAQAGSDLYPRQDLLDDPDKWAVCGPLGIMAFAAMRGTPIDYETAKEAARKAGWTPQRGMAGPQSQVAALNSIGVPSKTGAIDLEMIKREVRNGNPVGLSSPGATGHYFTVQAVDDQGRLDLGNSALSLSASGATKRWWTLDELRAIGPIGAVDTAIYIDNPASPTPSVAVSLNAAPASPPAPGAAAPEAAGVPPAPAASPPPSPWANEQAGNGPLMLKENDETAPMGGGDAMLPGDGGYAPTPYEQPYNPDDGPREATPGSVGSQPLPQPAYADPTVSDPAYTQNPNAAPMVDPLDPSTITPAALPPLSNGPRMMQPQPQYRDPREGQGIIARGIDAIGQYLPSAPIVDTKPGDAGVFMSTQPNTVGRLWEWRGRVAEGAADALSRGTGLDPDALVLNVEVGGIPIQMTVSELLENVTDPLLAAGWGVGDMVLDAAGRAVLRLVAPYAKGAARETIGRLLNSEPVQRGVEAVREGAEAVGRGLGNVGREVAGQLMDLNPAMTPRIIGDGPGIGRSMADGAIPSQSARNADAAIPSGIADSGPNNVPNRTQSMPSQRLYHGTGSPFDVVDPSKFDENGLFGPGYYLTSDPRVANGYASVRAGQFEPIGANVRAVDVPKNLRLWDLDAPGVGSSTFEALDSEAKWLTGQRLSGVGPNSTPEAVYDAFVDRLISLGLPPGEAKAEVNRSLVRVFGFDGIKHTGGRRNPLMDADGNPIEHDVTIIFPESLTKIRNAFSGEVGGATLGVSPGPRGAALGTQLATDAGNALAGSMVGAVAPADTPEERLRNTALGAAGFPIAGRLMRRAGGALGTPGIGPNGRPSKPTVEVLQEQLDGMRALIQRARAEGNTDLERRAIDRAWQLESALVDARNARLDLEPRITSDVGRRIEDLPLDARSADDFAGLGRERVSPQDAADLTPPSAVATDMRGRQNSLMPGFDPASAAMGGAAGAASEGEDGEQGDPLRTAAGIGLGAFGARVARQPGKTFAFGAKPGQRIEFNVKVVPLRDLVTSHTDALSINRAFPQELQPRVRERTASKVQIDKIVSTFDPEQVLVDTHRVDSGPMIVGEGNVVESGNGRSIALRRLAKENPEAYAEYVQALREELPRYGLTEDALNGIDQPVLVRERVTPMTPAERAQYAADANVGVQARMAPVEQAMQDAGRISDDAVSRIVVGEDQTIDEALMAAENGGFRRAFMASVPESEWGELLTADGNLNPRGLARVKDALLAKTYQGSAGARLATAFVDSLDSGIKNVQHGIMGSLPTVARAEARIAAGEIDPGLSIANDMAVAADVYSRLRRRKTILKDYLAQSGMFEGRETTPFQDRILAYLDENARSPKRIRAMLDEYARIVDGMAGADQVDMFGLPIPQATKEEVFDGVLRRLGAASDADQSADLGRVGAGSNLVEGAGPGAAPVPPEAPRTAPPGSAGSDAGTAAGPQLTADEQLARFNAARGTQPAAPTNAPQPLRPANLPPVADDLIPPTGGEAGRLQVEGAPQPVPRPSPVGNIVPRTGGPEGALQQPGAPTPLARPTQIPRDVLPPTGGEAGTLAQEGAPAPPARPLEEVVRDIVGDGASRPASVESPPGLNIRRLARGIQLAAANPSPQIGLPGFPAPPPQARPSWWDLAQTWRYSMGLFGQLSTALMQGLGGVAEVGLGAPSELIRQAVLRGHPEHVPLIIGEALKSIPRGAKEFGTTAAGRVPETIMAGSDYRPPLSDQLSGGARTAARIIETPGRVATQAPDAFWYEVFYRTGLAQAAAEQAQRRGASRLDPVGSYRMQQELIANPTADMIARAHEFAQSSTYKGELGSVAKAIGKVFRGPENPTSGLGKAWKEVGSFLMPVYHTIARIHEGALEYVPGIGALPLEAAGLAAKGRPLDQKIAQQVVGMAVAGSMLAYAASGNVRGPGPNDSEKLKQMRDQGYEPNTTKVGDYWVPNAYFGRFGPILNTIGAMNDAMLYGDGAEQWNGARFDRQVRMVAKNFGRAFNDYPTAQAVSTLIKIKDDPVGALAEFAGGTAAQFVPAAYRSYATATDERVRRPERGKDVPPEQRFADTFAQRSGIGRQSLPEAQDVLGRPVVNQRQGTNVLFPRVGSDRPDAVIDAFQRGGVDIPKPDDSISIRNMVPESQRPPGSPSSFSVALTPEEQREWNTLRGQELIKQANILLARRGWAEKPQAQRQADLKLALEAARRAADGAMQQKLGTSEVNKRIRDGLQKKAG